MVCNQQLVTYISLFVLVMLETFADSIRSNPKPQGDILLILKIVNRG